MSEESPDANTSATARPERPTTLRALSSRLRAQSASVKIASVALLVAGLVVGGGVVALATPGPTDSAQYKTLQAKEQSLQGELNDARATVDSDSATIDSQDQNLADLQSQVDKLRAAEASVKKREDAVAKREAAASKAEAAQNANSFSDGTFVVGSDIQPGTYKTSGGDGCYWARLSDLSGAFGGIIANDNVSGQATVTIASSDKGFESDNCGTWTKIG